MAVGCYPGSFNPPTVAHLAVAEAAVAQCGLDRVDLVLSRDALGKDGADVVAVEHRLAVLEAVASTRPWLGARLTDRRLVADIAEGYDVVVMGADKWAQVADPVWYDDDPARRDEMVARLPRLALAPRHGTDGAAVVLPAGTVVLAVDGDHLTVSATGVRAGRHEWMAPEALAHARRTGAWSVLPAPGRSGRP
jgi:hypothetical protein